MEFSATLFPHQLRPVTEAEAAGPLDGRLEAHAYVLHVTSESVFHS